MQGWKQPFKRSRPHTRKLSDFEVKCYIRGWNAALRAATGMLKDFLVLREEDIAGWDGNGTTGRTMKRADG